MHSVGSVGYLHRLHYRETLPTDDAVNYRTKEFDRWAA